MFLLKKEWLEKVKEKEKCFLKILKQCLAVKKEQVLIIADYGEENRQLSALFAYGYYFAAQKLKLPVQLLFQKPKKGFMQADSQIAEALYHFPQKNIVILCVSQKLGRLAQEKSFRTFCSERQHRFLSTTGLGDSTNTHFDLFLEAMDINYARLQKKGLRIKKMWDKAKEIRIKTKLGTDLIFQVEKMQAIANVGDYRLPGQGGNMPAGEVYIPPQGYYGVQGKVVIDGSMKTEEGAVMVKEPLTLFIENGRVVKIEGAHAPLLEKTLCKYEDRAKYPYRVRHIGELGLGINSGAVLTGSTIIDEKVLGTAHVALGSNYWFGGAIRTIFHGDQIFKDPQVFLDGKEMKL